MFRRRIDGGAILGTICICLFLYAKFYELGRSKREDRIQGLCRKIGHHATDHPRADPFKLEELVRHGVVTAEDEAFLKQEEIEYRPVNHSSVPHGVVFVRRGTDTDTLYYASGKTGSVIRWPSPDKRFILYSTPGKIETDPRQLVLFEAATGNTLYNLQTERTVWTLWSPDSRAVVINALGRGKERPVVLRIDGREVIEGALAAELDPETLLPEADRQQPIRWSDNKVVVRKWLAPDRLEVETHAGGCFLNAEGRPDRPFSHRGYFVVQFQADGSITIIENRTNQPAHHPGPPQA